MKKYIIITSMLIGGISSSLAQTTATNFTANDCDGNSHTLFDELDACKVVVIAWVMPCATCISDPLSAYTTVQSYASSHPGKILYYMVDDYANTSCSSLEGWANNYGMGGVDAFFSDASISMSDYGTDGMPKIVILGGGQNHNIYFNKNSNIQGFQASLDVALTESCVGIDEKEEITLDVNSYPNPVNDLLNVSYELGKSSMVSIKLFNLLGAEVTTMECSDMKTQGSHMDCIDVSAINDGVYFLSVETEYGVKTEKITISH